MIWQIELAELLRILAIICVAAGLAALFRRRETAFIGAARWALLGLFACLAVVHCGFYLAQQQGFAISARNAELFSSGSLLLLALGQSWFLLHVRARMIRAMGPALQRRFSAADAEFFEARRSLELAEEIAHVGYWRYDLPQNRLVWSDEIFRMHGVSKRDYTPNLYTAIHAFHEEDRELASRAFWDAARRGEKFDFRARLVRAGGDIRYVRSRGVAQLDERGNVASVFCAVIDITEQKQVEDALLSANLLAEQVNRDLQAMALVDALTGLPNRRHFDAAFEAEQKRASREQAELGLIMIDLDHFKGYNDLFGHPAGDECLRRVAGAIRGMLMRPGDLVARYGGEELVVLLPGTDLAGAAVVATVIADAVRDLRLDHPATPAEIVTISCGVAVFDPRLEPGEQLTLIERADRALYEAKQTGRNRVVCDTVPCAAGAQR
jgi:diguanylate cyclase (GGDEF)-like protein/PAS domain S-box-containing protein